MLELGGKINAPFTYKAYFQSLGYRHVSIDWNAEHGALKRDLRERLMLGTFDMVTNIGTSEHVQGQYGVWQNLVEACRVGSVLICTTPKPGQWLWHGWHHPHAEFYRELAGLNGFNIERLYENGEDPLVMNFCRMVRTELRPFTMPNERHIHFNPGGSR